MDIKVFKTSIMNNLLRNKVKTPPAPLLKSKKRNVEMLVHRNVILSLGEYKKQSDEQFIKSLSSFFLRYKINIQCDKIEEDLFKIKLKCSNEELKKIMTDESIFNFFSIKRYILY